MVEGRRRQDERKESPRSLITVVNTSTRDRKIEEKMTSKPNKENEVMRRGNLMLL